MKKSAGLLDLKGENQFSKYHANLTIGPEEKDTGV